MIAAPKSCQETTSNLLCCVDNRLACVPVAVALVKELCYDLSLRTQNERSRMRQTIAVRPITNPVGVDYFAPLIGQQRKGNIIPFGESCENFLRVVTNPDNLNTGFFQLRQIALQFN